jgi:hypothetical protein
MTDFFTNLVSQVLQPAAEIYPAITVQYGPEPNVSAALPVPEPPVLDSAFQPVSDELADPVEVPQIVGPIPDPTFVPHSVDKLTDGSRPFLPGIQSPQHSPIPEKHSPGLVEESATLSHTKSFQFSHPEEAPFISSISSSAEENEVGHTSVEGTGTQPVSRQTLPPRHPFAADEAGPSRILPSPNPIEGNEILIGSPSDQNEEIEHVLPKATERYPGRITRRKGTMPEIDPGDTPATSLQNVPIPLRTDLMISTQEPQTRQEPKQQVLPKARIKENDSEQQSQIKSVPRVELPLSRTKAQELPKESASTMTSALSSAEIASADSLMEGDLIPAFPPRVSLRTEKRIEPTRGESYSNNVQQFEKDSPEYETGAPRETPSPVQHRRDLGAILPLSARLPDVQAQSSSPESSPSPAEIVKRPAAPFQIKNILSPERGPDRPGPSQTVLPQNTSNPLQLQSRPGTQTDVFESKANGQRQPGEIATVEPATLPLHPADPTLPVEESHPPVKVRRSLKMTGAFEPLPDLSEHHPGGVIRPVIAAEPIMRGMIHTSDEDASESSTPTVRLTIGRIVVKAAPQAAPTPSAPVPSRRQAPVSLSDYLGRHRRNQ